MLRSVNLKIYRKFLILAVLSGSVFLFSSAFRTAALPCCAPRWAVCMNTYNLCVLGCATLDRPQHDICVENCEAALLNCYVLAEPCDPSPLCPEPM